MFRLWKKFLKFCEDFGNTHLDKVKHLTKETPTYIVNWIMENCESEASAASAGLEVGKGCTFNHALKMRAAVSWGFAYELGICGKEPWMRMKSGEYQGNPSISHEVGRYMVSLNKRKVCNFPVILRKFWLSEKLKNQQIWAGEVPTSKRAIVEKDLVDFFKKNDTMKIKDWNTDYRKLDELSNWAGPLQRLMLQAIYLIAFTCLLRFDEVLKIQHHHIEVVDPNYGHIRLMLPFRKTHQKGQIKPFPLWFRPEKKHLDPVNALLKWVHCSGITSGFLFRRITRNDQVSQIDKPLVSFSKVPTSETFLTTDYNPTEQ